MSERGLAEVVRERRRLREIAEEGGAPVDVEREPYEFSYPGTFLKEAGARAFDFVTTQVLPKLNMRATPATAIPTTKAVTRTSRRAYPAWRQYPAPPLDRLTVIGFHWKLQMVPRKVGLSPGH